MPHPPRPPLRRSASFEPSRLADQLATVAYEQVVPLHRRSLSIPSPPRTPSVDDGLLPVPVSGVGG